MAKKKNRTRRLHVSGHMRS